jgi:hypothetical protein
MSYSFLRQMTTLVPAIVLNAGNAWAAYCGTIPPPHK